MTQAPPYPKIANLYASKDGGEARAVGVLKHPGRTSQIARWLVTEKIDGQNMRVALELVGHGGNCPMFGGDCMCDPEWTVNFYGRTNKAEPVKEVIDHLTATFPLESMKRLWKGQRSCQNCGGTGVEDSGQPKWLSEVAEPFPYACDCVEPYPITLYGEAYGAGIQKGGGDYRKDGDVSFRLFDVLVGEHWLDWCNVEAIAATLGVKTVPLLAQGVVSREQDIVTIVRGGFVSFVAEEEGTLRMAEGVVARTDPYLFDNNGRRVVFKTKTLDY